jgi:hypothetical protein
MSAKTISEVNDCIISNIFCLWFYMGVTHGL